MLVVSEWSFCVVYSVCMLGAQRWICEIIDCSVGSVRSRDCRDRRLCLRRGLFVYTFNKQGRLQGRCSTLYVVLIQYRILLVLF